jgi:hypothetical protein
MTADANLWDTVRTPGSKIEVDGTIKKELILLQIQQIGTKNFYFLFRCLQRND